MPVLYSIKFKQTKWNRYVSQSFSASGNCLDKYCIDWNWNALSNCPQAFHVTWNNTSCCKEFAKTWTRKESCKVPNTLANGVYVETEKKPERFPLSWQWSNFLCQSENNDQNTPVTWEQSLFQTSNQLTWTESSGPCETIVDIIVTNISSTSVSSTTYSVSSISAEITKEAFIRVLEIPPVAYLQVLSANSSEQFSPYTVRLSPSKIKCGSFPIEKIIWDLGDGSPLLEQRRWSNTLSSPFVFSDELVEDYQDPRNYDVIHTYTKTPDSDFCFYPSITAYCSSTGSYDCAATIVGPLKLKPTDDVTVKILQNELTDNNGRVLIGQVGNVVSAWRADK